MFSVESLDIETDSLLAGSIQNGRVTVGNNDTTPSGPDSLLGEFKKTSKSRISETTI